MGNGTTFRPYATLSTREFTTVIKKIFAESGENIPAALLHTRKIDLLSALLYKSDVIK